MVSLKLPQRRMMTAPAEVWKRFAAFVIDLLIIDLVLFGPFTGFFASWQPTWSAIVQQELVLPPGFAAAIALLGVLSLLYFSLFEYYLGATLGMRLFGLQVGGERTVGRCLIRNAYALPFFPFTVLWIVEPLHLVFRKERLLERWSRTATVQTVTL